MTAETDALRDHVRQCYAAAATAVSTGTAASCCGVDTSSTVYDVAIGERFGSQLYGSSDRDQLPSDAVTASLGCGNPLAVAVLHEGDRCSTWAPAAESMCCCPPGGSGPPAGRTGWT